MSCRGLSAVLRGASGILLSKLTVDARRGCCQPDIKATIYRRGLFAQPSGAGTYFLVVVRGLNIMISSGASLLSGALAQHLRLFRASRLAGTPQEPRTPKASVLIAFTPPPESRGNYEVT